MLPVVLQVALRLRGAISSKQLGYEDLLAPLIAEACIDVVPSNPHNFNVDNVRIVKIMGGALPDSQVRFAIPWMGMMLGTYLMRVDSSFLDRSITTLNVLLFLKGVLLLVLGVVL